MDLYVNGEKLDVTLEAEKTVGDILRSFEETCEKNHLATVGIKLDGKQINADDFDKAALVALKKDTKLDLSVVSEKAVQESFASLGKNFITIADQMEQIPVDLQSGKNADAHKTITLLADILDQFCHTATLSALFPQTYGNLKIDGKPLNDFFADFSKILSDFQQALESKDMVSIGDLAEYEICPRLRSIASAAGISGETAHE